MELHMKPEFVFKKKNNQEKKIDWTHCMLAYLIANFSTKYNSVLAQELNVSPRNITRKARELKLEKELDFLDLRRKEITEMAIKAHPGNKYKGHKGWSVPNSEFTRFKPGNFPPSKNNPDIMKKVHEKRNKSIATDRLRLKYGLPQITKLKLKY